MMANSSPARPRMTLRIGLAGIRNLNSAGQNDADDGLPRLQETLKEVFNSIGIACSQILTRAKQTENSVTRFYSDQKPLIRLITGLAEGSDAIGANALLHIETEDFETEFAAVLPWDRVTYRNSRDADFHSEYDSLIRKCRYVLELDGFYDNRRENDVGVSSSDAELASRRRARGYKAQSKFLLRQCDLVVAVVDTSSNEGTKSGGTIGTIQKALDLGLPVVLVDFSDLRVLLLDPNDDVDEQLLRSKNSRKNRTKTQEEEFAFDLTQQLNYILAGPDCRQDSLVGSNNEQPKKLHAKHVSLFNYFDSDLPPRDQNGNRIATLPERLWSQFNSLFKVRSFSSPDARLEPICSYRQHATYLNYHYVGIYRGTFFVSYSLGVLAVLVAAVSLVVMGQQYSSRVNAVAAPINAIDEAGERKQENLPSTTPFSKSVQQWQLVSLAVAEFAIVAAIMAISLRSEKEEQNEKAVGFRFLAERLRVHYYLARLGCFRTKQLEVSQFASRADNQTELEWLHDAIVRSIGPDKIRSSNDEEQPLTRSVDSGTVFLGVKPIETLDAINDYWVEGQMKYHESNQLSMQRMATRMKLLATICSISVCVIVGCDIVLLLLEKILGRPALSPGLSVGIVMMTAVLPALVAAINGVRLQSECQRLADRSKVLHRVLENYRKGVEKVRANIKSPEGQELGSWAPEVLRLAESIARETTAEAAEWAVIYGRETA